MRTLFYCFLVFEVVLTARLYSQESSECTSDLTPFFFVKKSQIGEIVGKEFQVSESHGSAYFGGKYLLWNYSQRYYMTFNEIEKTTTESIQKIYKVEEVGWGFKDKGGQIVIDPQYQSVQPFCNGFAGVKLNGKWGFINKAGEVVIPLQYTDAGFFSDGVAPVRIDSRWTLINKKGVSCGSSFVRLGPISEGLTHMAIFDSNDELSFGFIDKTCRVVIPPQYDGAVFFRGAGAVKKANKWAFIDASGKLLSGFDFEEAKPFYDRLWKVIRNRQLGLVHSPVNAVAPIFISAHVEPSEHSVGVQKGKYWGFLDSDSGNWITKVMFTSVKPFSFERAVVNIGSEYPWSGSYGYITREGNWLMEQKFTSFASSFGQNEQGLISAFAANSFGGLFTIYWNGEVTQ